MSAQTDQEELMALFRGAFGEEVESEAMLELIVAVQLYTARRVAEARADTVTNPKALIGQTQTRVLDLVKPIVTTIDREERRQAFEKLTKELENLA